jgi:hypothetical protein
MSCPSGTVPVTLITMYVVKCTDYGKTSPRGSLHPCVALFSNCALPLGRRNVLQIKLEFPQLINENWGLHTGRENPAGNIVPLQTASPEP